MPSVIASMADIRLEVVTMIREVGGFICQDTSTFLLPRPLTVFSPPYKELTKMETRVKYLEDELRHLLWRADLNIILFLSAVLKRIEDKTVTVM